MNIISATLRKLNLPKLIQPNIQKTRRIIVDETENHSIVLFHWKKNHRLHMHNHKGKCVFHMLNGTINETRIVNKKIEFHTLQAGSIGKLKTGDLHTMMPVTDSVSIHYYSPVPKRLCPTMEHVLLK